MTGSHATRLRGQGVLVLVAIPLVLSLLVALLYLHMLEAWHLAERAAWALTGLVLAGAALGTVTFLIGAEQIRQHYRYSITGRRPDRISEYVPLALGRLAIRWSEQVVVRSGRDYARPGRLSGCHSAGRPRSARLSLANDAHRVDRPIEMLALLH